MKNQNIWQIIIIYCLILGILFRLTNIDRKIYWYDESFTSLRVSGYTEAIAVQELSKAGIVSLPQLQKYQQINPQHTIFDTIKSLALEDPHHPPFYYIIANCWSQIFGTSITAMRMLPALCSLLVFPAIYWLCLELFNSHTTARIAIGLIALSPFHLIYAQEARQYSLWTATTLLSSAAFLRAIRCQTRLNWLIYAITLIINFYTFLFSILVAISQAIYLFIITKYRHSKITNKYLLSLLIAIIAFTPWLIVVINNTLQIRKVTAFTEAIRLPLWLYLRGRLGELTRIFIDFNTTTDAPLSTLLLQIPIFIIILSVIIYSFYFVYTHTNLRTWLFICTLTGSILLPLFLADLILGGNRLAVSRYLIPSYLGIQLAVAYTLAHHIHNHSKFWQILTALILSLGLLSCAISSQAEIWWNQNNTQGNLAIARVINQSKSPLVISDTETGDILSLSHFLKPNTKFLLKPQCYTCNIGDLNPDQPRIINIPDGFSDVFFYHPRPSLLWLENFDSLNQQNTTSEFQPIFSLYDYWLWKF